MQACYEQAIQTEPDDVSHHQGLLRGLMDLGQHSKALHHATGAIAERYVISFIDDHVLKEFGKGMKSKACLAFYR